MSPYSVQQTHQAAGAPGAPAGAPSFPGSGTASSYSGQPAGLPGKSTEGHLLITGVPGTVCNRLEIHDFVKNEKFFSLYIQALSMFTFLRSVISLLFICNVDLIGQYPQENVESFFQIGGIHGRPYEDWDGATASDDAGKYLGYCTHGTTLFPTWHRPYVLLLEVHISFIDKNGCYIYLILFFSKCSRNTPQRLLIPTEWIPPPGDKRLKISAFHTGTGHSMPLLLPRSPL